MRARVLLERVRGAPATPNKDVIGAIRRVIPDRTNVISFAMLNGALVAWLIRRDGVQMHLTTLDAPLEPLVDRFFLAVSTSSSDSERRAAAGQLYRVLIAPFRDKLEPDSRLVIIPDKRLHFVPFAALFDADRGRFLVESFEISVAPSVELYVESLARLAKSRSTGPPTVLAVGNPSFDPRMFTLPTLPGAEREAAQVARAYGRARLLVGAAATPRAFFEAAASADVIHFAGHGVVRPEAPLLSHLVLAPDPAGNATGAIYARDLYATTFAHTRLAILSGCHTASGELSDTEGASSLARAFFASGVPVVIASLWAVEDEGTADFFVAFHKYLARGDDPVAALRRTQRDWLAQSAQGSTSSALSTWAAFEVFGAGPARGSGG
jgi:CHAT domain-containing protein